MAQGDVMEPMRGIFGKLPPEIIQHLLSFLSVPELCRMRTVCKAWKEIISRPSFHDLCDENGSHDEYLFMWSEHVLFDPHYKVVVNPIFSDTLSFLDVDARRWYSIPAADLPRVCGCGQPVESRFMAMDHGLVCEVTSAKDCADNEFVLFISDPVAKTRRMLPTPSQVSVVHGTLVVSSLVAAAVDDARRSYKVFLLNNIFKNGALRAQPRVHVHESFTDEWRALTVPDGVEEEEEGEWVSSVVIHDSLFMLRQHHDGAFNYRLSLFRYKSKDDAWAEVYKMYFPRNFQCSCQLVVSKNRLFLNVWLGVARSLDPTVNLRFSDPGLKSDPDCHDPLKNCPNPKGCLQYPDFPDTDTHTDTDSDSYFEMHEVLIADNRRKLVVQLTRHQVQQIFAIDGSKPWEFDVLMDVTHAFPCFDSNGHCNALMLVEGSEFGYRIIRYDLATEALDVLPPHPLAQLLEESDGQYSNEYSYVENMKLSLRNLLAQPPRSKPPGGVDSWKEDATTTADNSKGTWIFKELSSVKGSWLFVPGAHHVVVIRSDDRAAQIAGTANI